jgi:E3 ubiquitin-protein ligase RNF1/2
VPCHYLFVWFSLAWVLIIFFYLQELAFSEEERSRNKKIQATIEETIRRQSEAVGKKRSTAKATATVFARKYRRNMRTRGRGKTIAPDIAPTGSDNEDREEGNAIDTTKESSSADDRSSDLMPKRGRKRPASRASPARTIGSSDHVFEENDELIGGKESFTTSPLRGEMLAWGKNGTRSQTRHGSVGGSNGRMAKGGRVAKLVDHLRTTDDMDKEFNLYLVLLPLDEQSMPNLDKPYISCRPTLSIRHLVQFIALQLSRQVEELDIFMRIDHCNGSVTTQDCTTGVAKMRLSDGLERIREDKLLSELHPSFTSHHGDLELLYALKTQG